MVKATMLSPVRWVISYQLENSLRVSQVGPSTRLKHSGSWMCKGTARWKRPSEVDCPCVRLILNVVSRREHSLRLRSHWKWPKWDPSLIFGARIGPCSNTRVAFDTVSQDMSPELSSRARLISLKSLPAILALTVITVFRCTPAYAELEPTVVGEGNVQADVLSSMPSVESILAKQLARRFREMSDEELVDILQQLLKASRSSISSQNAVDDGIARDELIIRQESGQVDNKFADRIIHTPKTFGTQPGNAQVNEKIDEAPILEPEEANGQVDKKTGHSNKTKGGTKQESGVENKVFSVSPTTTTARPAQNNEDSAGSRIIEKRDSIVEINPGDSYGTNQSGVSGTSGEGNAGAGSLSGQQDGDVEEEDAEGKRLAGLLWAEWSRRLEGQDMQTSGGQTPSTTFGVADLWQNWEVFSMKVVAVTVWVFERREIVTVGSLMFVLAFYIGRFSGNGFSIIKEVPKKEKDIQNLPIVPSDGTVSKGDSGDFSASVSNALIASKEDVGTRVLEFIPKYKRLLDPREREENVLDTLPMEGKPGIKSDPEKWWKREAREGTLLDTEGTLGPPTRSIPSTSSKSSDIANSNAGGKLNYSLYSQRYNNRKRTASEWRGSGIDAANSSKTENLIKSKQGDDEAFLQLNIPKYPSSPSVIDNLDESNNELQASSSQLDPGKSRYQRQVERKKLDAGSDHAVLDMPFIGTSDSVNLVQTGESTSKVGNFKLEVTPQNEILNSYQKKREDHRAKPAPYLDSNEWFRTDKLEHTRARKNGKSGTSNGNWRKAEIEMAIQSKDEVDSFVHGSVLWVRDLDGVFIQQPGNNKDRGNRKIPDISTDQQKDVQDLPSSKQWSSGNLRNTNTPSTTGPKKVGKRFVNGFDYKQLFIQSTENSSMENLSELKMSAGLLDPGRHIWPLKYGSQMEKVSE